MEADTGAATVGARDFIHFFRMYKKLKNIFIILL